MVKRRFFLFALILLLLLTAGLVIALALSRGGQNAYKGAQLVYSPQTAGMEWGKTV